MRQNNRTYRSLVFLVGISCLVFLSFGCDNKEDKSENEKKSGEFASKMLGNLAKPDQEIVALLAVKYNKNLDLIEKIADIYLTATDYGYRQIKLAIQERGNGKTRKPKEVNLELFALDKSAYADTVVTISNQFSLDTAIVASILVDYRTWKAAESRAGFE